MEYRKSYAACLYFFHKHMCIVVAALPGIISSRFVHRKFPIKYFHFHSLVFSQNAREQGIEVTIFLYCLWFEFVSGVRWNMHFDAVNLQYSVIITSITINLEFKKKWWSCSNLKNPNVHLFKCAATVRSGELGSKSVADDKLQLALSQPLAEVVILCRILQLSLRKT